MSLGLAITPYRLPLRRPWHSARGRLTTRQGWLISASLDGVTGYGDCAPLPAAGTEDATAAQRQLAHWLAVADGLAGGNAPAALLDLLAQPRRSPAPAADCGVETALLDLQARLGGQPLRRLLAGDALDCIAVNGVLGAAATLTPQQAADAVATRGWQVLKLKLGVAPHGQELERLRRAADWLPEGVTLRLDANGAWDGDTAAAVVAGLNGLPVDALEEPLAEPTDAALAALQAQAAFSLALDESLADRPRPMDADSIPVRRLVLKPAVIGGLRPALRLARAARASAREVVLTSIVESAAGLWATAQLAAATGSPLAHGLATADWLATDLGPAPAISRGHVRLPDSAGSGFRPGRWQADDSAERPAGDQLAGM
ncbi:o-succinylbenzoate synthase [Thiohalocapsa marina]|uniref:O-succinylbenzoate synthase n=1 Tax=Thiohalocapsa marina TaxID=424902 RepID=A0A5M8FUE1_9GAMM|nr:enolase C-terminal domain-like protein [Thiohalocapsa marina]KAA6187441.1 o-succinylbenzoate synthase [Thiohalocapsa marina]